MSRDHERYEVRLVDAARRVYVPITSDRKYHDACIQADTVRSSSAVDIVVLDGHEGHRVLYDSRAFRRKTIAGVPP